MRIEDFRQLLEIHGADFARWPAGKGAEAEKLIAANPAANKTWKQARRLDDLVARQLNKTPDSNFAAAARVISALRQPLPRQKGTLLSRLPSILLDWNFAPAWPRVAALAGCAALGFAIGLSGLDPRIGGSDMVARAGTADITSLVSDAEPLSGLDP